MKILCQSSAYHNLLPWTDRFSLLKNHFYPFVKLYLPLKIEAATAMSEEFDNLDVLYLPLKIEAATASLHVVIAQRGLYLPLKIEAATAIKMEFILC